MVENKIIFSAESKVEDLTLALVPKEIEAKREKRGGGGKKENSGGEERHSAECQSANVTSTIYIVGSFLSLAFEP